MDPNQNNQNQPLTPPQPTPGLEPPAPLGQPPQPIAEPVAAPAPSAMDAAPQPIIPVQPFTPSAASTPFVSTPVVDSTMPSIAPPLQPMGSGPDMTTPPQPIQPQAQFGAPGVPVSMPQPAQVPPAPQPFGAYPAPTAPGSKLPIKLIAIIGGSVAGVALLGGIGWFVYSSFFNMIPLKTYEGDSFSILVPEEYKEDSSEFGDTASFKEPGDDKDTQSGETINVLDVSELGDQREEIITETDKNINEESVADTLGNDSDEKITDYKLAKTKVDGQEARRISATVEKDGKKVGNVHMLIVYGEDNFYYVMVLAHVSDPSFNNAADKILSSLKMK